MGFAARLEELIRACFSGLWVVSHEHQDALAEIAQLCHGQGWQLASWDIDRGLTRRGPADQSSAAPGASDPLAALRALGSLGTAESPSLLVLPNFHRFLGSAEIVQALCHQIALGKQHRNFVIVLSPGVEIPAELEKLFFVVQHDLPSREQLAEIARGIASEPEELPTGIPLEQILDAASGLTRYEAEGAFSLALVRHSRIAAATLWELKSQTLLKSGLLSLHCGRETFAELGGLEALKAFCLRSLRPRPSRAAACRPRGVLLLGIPGTGKSAFCKALGRETDRPTLVLDVGSLMGSLVGQTEERTRQALRMVDAMQPAILLVDEIEKALSGAAGSGSNDSGVSARLLGTLLSWLNDRDSDVFVVCTANDVTKLPPELTRAERFDAIFFLDLPGTVQKNAIWRQYTVAYQLETDQGRPDDTHWTGAEIKSCCRLAALLDIPLLQAGANVVPVAVTAAEAIGRLRSWAGGRCLSAEHAGIYVPDSPGAAPRRPRRHDPSSN